MDDAANPAPPPSTSTAASAAAAAAQHQQLQRQLFLMQQAQSHPQQLSQQAMSRFPSNIDAHLRPLGPVRFQQPQQPQPQPQPQPSHSQGPSQSPLQAAQQASPQQQQQAAAAQAQAQVARVRSPEMEMALQDAMRVCNPDVKTPFQSIEDVVNRCATVGFVPNLATFLFGCVSKFRSRGISFETRICGQGEVVEMMG